MEHLLGNEEYEDFSKGKHYQKSMEREIKKAHGKYYTPGYIIDFILEKTLANANVIEEPFIKVLDPACGCGFFLLKAYDLLKEKFLKALPELRQRYVNESYIINKSGMEKIISGEKYWEEKYLHYHLLKHCIYGADIDKNALWLCKESLLLKDKTKYYDKLNIIYCDSLSRIERDYDLNQILEEFSEYRLFYEMKNLKEDKMEYASREQVEETLIPLNFWSKKYDYIIGNPPYVGHKELSMEYKKWLLKHYGEVFKDKSDLSYCFYQRALECIKDNGNIAFISTRYFMESPTGRSLRKYLQRESKIIRIVDFYGEEIFKGVGVAAAIFFLTTGSIQNNMIEIWKYDKGKIDHIHSNDFEIFDINQESLKEDRWVLIPDWKMSVMNNINACCSTSLGSIVESFQGVITGCDKAFILDESIMRALHIEEDLLKTWIKNSDVERYKIRESSLKLIYSDMIDKEENYTNSIKHIRSYRERLENRRECIKGSRLWYQLQWGRNPKLFTKEKIVYPYKSKNNRFAIDKNGCFCSADVYSFVLKDQIKEYTLPFLIGVLNSSIYDFYFKLYAKKMGSGMYDYYPNTVMELKIPDYEACKEIEPLSIELMELYKNNDNLERKKSLEHKIDSILNNYFSL